MLRLSWVTCGLLLLSLTSTTPAYARQYHGHGHGLLDDSRIGQRQPFNLILRHAGIDPLFPEELARHYAAAGLNTEAIGYYRKAATQAGRVLTDWEQNFLADQQTHVEWVGCSLHDIIQPSFSFLVGVPTLGDLVDVSQATGRPLTARLATAQASAPGREDYLRVRLVEDLEHREAKIALVDQIDAAASMLGGVRIERADWPRILFTSLIGMLGYSLGSAFGFAHVSAGMGSLVIGTQPLLIALLASLVAHERLTNAAHLRLRSRR
jgi:hypothetical protein